MSSIDRAVYCDACDEPCQGAAGDRDRAVFCCLCQWHDEKYWRPTKQAPVDDFCGFCADRFQNQEDTH
jgi:hypothetical protein